MKGGSPQHATAAAALARGRASVGMARQSVVQIADALGIDLAAVAGQGISAATIGDKKTHSRTG